MKTPIDVILAVDDIGGRLGVAGDKLRVLLPPNCPPSLKEAIRQYKSALLRAIQPGIWIVRSDTLKTIVLWVPDDATKEWLAGVGVDPRSIYTTSELEQLVNRRVTADELRLIHAAKQRFNGKVADR